MMIILKSFVRYIFVAAVIVGAGAFVVTNYSWVFAKRVKGRIINVERVTDPSAIISARATDEQMHSYAILIQGDEGKLYTASSEDRKWQVAKKGYCVDTLLYRYPPWNFNKANTFFNARLDELSLCPGETQAPPSEPAAPAEAKPQIPIVPPVEDSAN
jgi:hypothetical protein